MQPTHQTEVALEKKKRADSHWKKETNPNLFNFIFYHWKALMQAGRSNKLLKAKQGFDFREQSNKNFKALLKRLRNLEGPYSEEMRQVILAKRKGIHKTSEHPILTPEEKNFLKKLLEGEWRLKHATGDYKLIQEKGNILLSLEERRRKGQAIKNSHTASAEGNTDNVFFTLGPGDIGSPKFLDYATTVISTDFKRIRTRAGTPEGGMDQSAAIGMWCSDHIYAYRTEQDSSTLNIYGTLCSTFYRKELDKNDNTVFVKYCRFQHPDGKITTQAIHLGEEIFAYPRMEIALLLMMIEKIRLLGVKAWDQILQEKDLQGWQYLVQTVFHPGVFEAHKPAAFKIEQPGVQVITREVNSSKMSSEDMKLQDDQMIRAKHRSIILAALMKRNGDVIEALNKKEITPMTEVRDFTNKIYYITLVGAAILGGNVDLIRELLSRGFSLNNNESIVSGHFEKFNMLLSPIECILLLNDFLQVQKVFQGLPELISFDAKQNSEAAQQMIHLFLKDGVAHKSNLNIKSLFQVEAIALERYFGTHYRHPHLLPSLKYLLEYSSHIESSALPFVFAALFDSSRRESLEIIDLLLARQADINQPLLLDQFTQMKLMNGCTPLMAAILNNDAGMVRYLLSKGADVNKSLRTVWKLAQAYRLHAWEGYTPTMIAIEKGATAVLDVLLEFKPNLTIKACNGLTAKSLALKKGGVLNDKIYLTTHQNGSDTKAEREIDGKVRLDQLDHMQIYDERMFVIFMGRNKKGEIQFGLRKNHPSDLFVKQLQFLDMPLQQFSNVDKRNFPDSVKRLVHFPSSRWQSLGGWSIDIPERRTHYQLGLMLCVLGDQSNASLSIENFHSSISSDQILKLLKGEVVPEMEALELHPFTLKILNSLMQMKEIRSFTETELKGFQDEFNSTLRTGYALAQAIAKEDLKTASDVIPKSSLIDFSIPVTEEFVNTHCSPVMQVHCAYYEGMHRFNPLDHSLKSKNWSLALLLADHLRPSHDKFLSEETAKDIIAADQVELLARYIKLNYSLEGIDILTLAVTNKSHRILDNLSKEQPDKALRIFQCAVNHLLTPVVKQFSSSVTKEEKIKALDILFRDLTLASSGFGFCRRPQDFIQANPTTGTPLAGLTLDEINTRVLELVNSLADILPECHHVQAIQAAIRTRNLELLKIILPLTHWGNTPNDIQHINTAFFDVNMSLMTNDLEFFEEILKLILTSDGRWSYCLPVALNSMYSPRFRDFFKSFYARHSPKAYTLIRAIKNNQPRLIETLTRDPYPIDEYVILVSVGNIHFPEYKIITLVEYALDCLLTNPEESECIFYLFHRGANTRTISWEHAPKIMNNDNMGLIKWLVDRRVPIILDRLNGLKLVYNVYEKLSSEQVETLKFLVKAGAESDALWHHVTRVWDVDVLQWLITQDASKLNVTLFQGFSKFELMRKNDFAEVTFLMRSIDAVARLPMLRPKILECIYLAIKQGADVSIKDKHDDSVQEYLRAVVPYFKRTEQDESSAQKMVSEIEEMITQQAKQSEVTKPKPR